MRLCPNTSNHGIQPGCIQCGGTGWVSGPSLAKAEALAPDTVVTSVRVEHLGGHEHVHIWNRGAKAGTIVVGKGDGEAIARRLIGEGVIVEKGEYDLYRSGGDHGEE